MGGIDGSGNRMNDVWLSTNNGESWTRTTEHADWSARDAHSSVVMQDGSIILTGGFDGFIEKNDVWRSTTSGTSWEPMSGSAQWAIRYSHSSVALTDGSIVVLGGEDRSGNARNDVWRSTDKGASWTQETAIAGWSARDAHSSVVMQDGSIVLMGGYDGGGKRNDVWRFLKAGSVEQHPEHTYALPGTYSVTLQVYNPDGLTSIQKAGYIIVQGLPAQVPEFPSSFLPATMIIGVLGAVLLIQRSRDH
jgi:hypothetical protein